MFAPLRRARTDRKEAVRDTVEKFLHSIMSGRGSLKFPRESFREAQP